MAELGMTAAAVGHQEGDEAPNGFYIGAVNDRTTVARAAHESRTGKNTEVRGQRIVRGADRLCDRSGRKPMGLGTHEKSEYFQALRLTKGGQGSKRVGDRRRVAALGRTNMPDHGQIRIRQISTPWARNCLLPTRKGRTSKYRSVDNSRHVVT